MSSDDNVIGNEREFSFNKKLKEAGYSVNTSLWQCKCGHDAFYVLDECYQCQSCGHVHTFEDVHGGYDE